MREVNLEKPISLKELQPMAERMFGNLVKAVVDLEKEIMIVDAELHSDQEALLLEQGSSQGNLWGINLHPDFYGEEDFVEFDSMINLRPSWGNYSRGVDDPKIQQQIREIVSELVVKE